MIKKTITNFINYLESESERYKIQTYAAITIVLLPLVIIPVFALSMILPQTRDAAITAVQENHFVEQLTFVFLMIGSFQGMRLALRYRAQKNEVITYVFYM